MLVALVLRIHRPWLAYPVRPLRSWLTKLPLLAWVCANRRPYALLAKVYPDGAAHDSDERARSAGLRLSADETDVVARPAHRPRGQVSMMRTTLRREMWMNRPGV